MENQPGITTTTTVGCTVWQVESVAAVSTPNPPVAGSNRRVHKRPGRTGLWAAVVLVFFIPHIWGGIFLARRAIEQLAFPLASQTVTASVIYKGTDGDRHYQAVGYKIADVERQAELTVSAENHLAVRNGDLVELKVADILGQSIVHHANYSRFPFLVFPALFWNFFVFIFVREFAWLPLARRWLIKRGACSDGVIDEVTRTHGRGGGVLITFHFTPTGHASVEGKMKVGHELFDRTSLDHVTIFYHARFPRMNVIYELSSWEISS